MKDLDKTVIDLATELNVSVSDLSDTILTKSYVENGISFVLLIVGYVIFAKMIKVTLKQREKEEKHSISSDYMMLLCIICITLGLVLLITTPIFIHNFITLLVSPDYVVLHTLGLVK